MHALDGPEDLRGGKGVTSEGDQPARVFFGMSKGVGCDPADIRTGHELNLSIGIEFDLECRGHHFVEHGRSLGQAVSTMTDTDKDRE